VSAAGAALLLPPLLLPLLSQLRAATESRRVLALGVQCPCSSHGAWLLCHCWPHRCAWLLLVEHSFSRTRRKTNRMIYRGDAPFSDIKQVCANLKLKKAVTITATKKTEKETVTVGEPPLPGP